MYFQRIDRSIGITSVEGMVEVYTEANFPVIFRKYIPLITNIIGVRRIGFPVLFIVIFEIAFRLIVLERQFII